MNATSSTRGEARPNKAAAIFNTTAAARDAAEALRASSGLPAALVRVVDASTPHPGRALEPESRGIKQLMLRAHAVLGVAGLAAGLLLFALLHRMGVGFVVNAPYAAAGAMAFFGAIAGLMLGGLATLRPDHDPYIVGVLEACRDGRAAVVVDGRTAAERDAAAQALAARGGEVIRTL